MTATGPYPDIEGPDPDAGEYQRDPGARPPSRFGRLRVANLDLRNTWQIVVGSLLLPLGIALILLAWSGAAHGRVDQQQIPYLVSGGLGGLAVVIIGCFFYWAHWLYRIYDQADLHHQEALAEQREMMRALIDALAAGAPAAGSAAAGSADAGGQPAGGRAAGAKRAGAATTGGAPTGGQAVAVGDNGGAADRTFVATPTGTNFHTAGCPMVANRAGQLRTVSEEEAADMKPCRVCEPLISAN